MSMTVTNNDIGSVIWQPGNSQDDVFTAAGAKTFPAGTILARDSVSGKLVVFVKGGSTNENGIPKAIFVNDVVAAGAGDLQVRPMLSGIFRKEKLIIDADGDDSNIDNAVRDQLRDYMMDTKTVQELNIQDNQ